MTEKQIRQKVVDTALSYLGCKESDGTHKKIIDLYNTYTPLPRGYRLSYSDFWCAATISAWAIQCGLTDIMPVECSCSSLITLYKNIKRWQEDETNFVPQIGDLVIYDWDDKKDYATTDNKGAPEHIGLVVEVTGKKFKVIEGNYNKEVKYRTMEVNGRYIRGFCLPDFASKATVEEPVVVPQPAEKEPEPKYSFGRTYRTQVDELSVRTGAGTNYRRKAFSELTTNAKKHAYGSGHLVKGTAVTCLATAKVGKDIWIRIPSGWCAAYYGGKYYIK